MMKRFANLYPTLTSFENLWLAAHKAARGKRGQPAVAAFDFNLEDELLRLQDELITETYQPGPYTSFSVDHEFDAPSRSVTGGRRPAGSLLKGGL